MLHPIAWYYPLATCGPVPCRWGGWVCLGPSLGRQWFEVSLFRGVIA